MIETAEASLSGQDLAFLAWESRTRPMHIAATAEFEGTTEDPLSVDVLRESLLPRLNGEPMLKRRLLRLRFRAPRWGPAEPIDIAAHVRSLAEVAKPGEALASTRARILAAPLDRNRPLWEVWLEPADQPTLVRLHFKVHHAVADGIGALALLERLFGERSARHGERGAGPLSLRCTEASSGVARRPRAAGTSDRAPETRRMEYGGSTRGNGLLRFVREHFARGVRTPLSGSVDDRRTYHALSVDVHEFDALRGHLRVSANDALLTIVAGAIERWLSADTDGPVPDSIRAFCPVSLREPGERSGGNRIAPWFVPLPLAGTSRTERARRIRESTRRLRSERAEDGGDRMARLVRRFGAWLAGLGMAIAAWRNAFDLVVTNVPGPRRELALSGRQLSGLAAYPPLFPGQRVCIAVVRTDGRWTLALHTGFRDPHRADRLAQALRAELRDALQVVDSPAVPELRAHSSKIDAA